MTRLLELETWLRTVLPGEHYEVTPASSDASFRRYFRVRTTERSWIVMDAPPAHEDCAPFIRIAQIFSDAGVHVPTIYAQDLQQGFLLLSDLGTETYLQALNEDNADDFYRAANAALIKIQSASREAVLPPYDRPSLLREMRLFPDWYVARHLQRELTPQQSGVLDEALQLILDQVLAQATVYVHRDYHSRNLMYSDPNPGILDFQDAVYGPITYDIVSLYKDAYIAWDEARILDWTIRYWESAKAVGLPVGEDFGAFYRDFEWMGVQRHLKVLGIFARLCYRDGKRGYLQDMPRVLAYVRATCERYRALGPLLQVIDELHGSTQSVGYSF